MNNKHTHDAAQAQQVDKSPEMQGKLVDESPNLQSQQPASGADESHVADQEQQQKQQQNIPENIHAQPPNDAGRDERAVATMFRDRLINGLASLEDCYLSRESIEQAAEDVLHSFTARAAALLYGMKTPVGREDENTPTYWEKQQADKQDDANPKMTATEVLARRAPDMLRSGNAQDRPEDGKQPEQDADLSDAICLLSSRIARAKIILTMLTNGEARNVLTLDETDELDWMLHDSIHSIGVAADALIEEVRT